MVETLVRRVWRLLKVKDVLRVFVMFIMLIRWSSEIFFHCFQIFFVSDILQGPGVAQAVFQVQSLLQVPRLQDRVWCSWWQDLLQWFSNIFHYIILKYISLVCYRKVHGIKGYGFGQGGPALLSGDALESVENVPADARLMIDEITLIFQIFLRFVDTTVIPADDDEDGCPRCGGK